MIDPMPRTIAVDDAEREAASENPHESRRGRPRATPPAFDEFAADNGDADKSRRTIIKRFFTARALGALDTQDQGFGYIIGPDRPRWEILAELGRLGDERAIREAAAEICRRRMKTKETVALLRRCRTGKARPGDVVALAREIGKAIDAYVISHPGTTLAQVRTALKLVGLCFAEGEGEPGDYGG